MNTFSQEGKNLFVLALISRSHVAPAMYLCMQNSCFGSDIELYFFKLSSKQKLFLSSRILSQPLPESITSKNKGCSWRRKTQRCRMWLYTFFEGKLCFNAASNSSSSEFMATKLSSKIAESLLPLFSTSCCRSSSLLLTLQSSCNVSLSLSLSELLYLSGGKGVMLLLLLVF